MIRANIPQYMAELKQWLRETEQTKLEDMAGFFRVRLGDYEAHMAQWHEAYLEMERRLPASVETVLDLGMICAPVVALLVAVVYVLSWGVRSLARIICKRNENAGN